MSQRRRESSSPRWTALNNQGEGIGRKTGLEGGVREEEEKESKSSQLDFVMDKARCTAGEKKRIVELGRWTLHHLAGIESEEGGQLLTASSFSHCRDENRRQRW